MNGAAAAAAAAAAVAKAIKASGVIVQVEPAEFQKLLGHNEQGLVVHAMGGLFSNKHKYLMSYKGLAFYTITSEAVHLPSACQVVEAQKIWIPS